MEKIGGVAFHASNIAFHAFILSSHNAASRPEPSDQLTLIMRASGAVVVVVVWSVVVELVGVVDLCFLKWSESKIASHHQHPQVNSPT